MSDISTKEFVSTKGKPRSIEELVRLSCHLPRYLKAAFGPYRSDEEARRALQLATKLGFPIKLTNYTFGTVGKNAHGPQQIQMEMGNPGNRNFISPDKRGVYFNLELSRFGWEKSFIPTDSWFEEKWKQQKLPFWKY